MNKLLEQKKFNISQIILVLIFVLALVLRVKSYLLARPLFHDECTLAASILTRSIFGFFQPLAYDQKAPAIFMMLSKAVTSIFGIKVLAIKLVSLISGLVSIGLFYFLSKKVLSSKFSIVVSNFLFAINYQLIYYCQKFKQYSFDVCVFMASLLIFSNLDLEKISYKKCLLYSLISGLLILASFPCIFVVGAYILFCLLKRVNLKKTLSFASPLVIFSLLYYCKTLYNIHKTDLSTYFDYWQGGFLTLDLNKNIMLIRENFNYFFDPNNFALIGFALFIFGLVLLIKNKFKTGEIILFSLLGVILTSFSQIYPMWQRMALYLLPIILLFICKPLDLVSAKRKTFSAIFLAFFVLYFSKYNFSYVSGFLKPTAFSTNDAITIFPKLVKRYKGGDILVVNSSTEADVLYYSQVYGFKAQPVIAVPITQFDKEYYHSVMDSLPRGYDYWFIFGWEYSHDSKFSSVPASFDSYIKEHHLKVLEKYEDGRSLLVKVKI